MFQGAEAGYKEGLEAYGRKDYVTALKEWKPLAEQGDAIAQFNLGLMYRKGQGVPRYYKEAVKWYRKAAEQGNAEGQYSLGGMYEFGWGIFKDYKKAVGWYRKASEQGNAKAQIGLGGMYRRGFGVPKDYVQAHMWFNISAVRGTNKWAEFWRYSVEKKMTPSQVSEAQRLARKWMRKHLQ
jgi:hypothetical protein